MDDEEDDDEDDDRLMMMAHRGRFGSVVGWGLEDNYYY
jgi:hypothetical protein